jgi:hypothetical protein
VPEPLPAGANQAQLVATFPPSIPMENRCPPSTATNKRESIENRTAIKYILPEELKESLYQWVPFVLLFER